MRLSTCVHPLLVACVTVQMWGAPSARAAGDIAGYPATVEAYDPRELGMLPRYCIYTGEFRKHIPAGNDAAEVQRLTALMGSTFEAMHHYCWGLMKTNRALLLAKTKQVRMFYLSASISEFDYVIERAAPDFVLLPEILTRKGENLIRLGNVAAGITELQAAIDAKRDYWPPYVALSDYYKQSGDVAKARELLETALSFAPDAKGVQRRIAALQGSDAGRKR